MHRTPVAMLCACATLSLASLGAGCATTSSPRSERVELATLPPEDEGQESVLRLRIPTPPEALHRQGPDDELCWAACAQTVRALVGEKNIPSQEQLREESLILLPNDDRQRAHEIEVTNALVPEYRRVIGPRYVFEPTDAIPVTDSQIVHSLWVGEPVVVGLQGSPTRIDQTEPDNHDYYWRDGGHAYVLVGATYRPTNGSASAWVDSARQSSSVIPWVKNLLNGKETKDAPEYRQMPPAQVLTVELYDPHPGAIESGSIFEAEWSEVRHLLGFALNRDEIRWRMKIDREWLDEHDLGPGVYVRNPLNGGVVSRIEIEARGIRAE